MLYPQVCVLSRLLEKRCHQLQFCKKEPIQQNGMIYVAVIKVKCMSKMIITTAWFKISIKCNFNIHVIGGHNNWRSSQSVRDFIVTD